MSDEEIEFLGSKPAAPPTLQRPVTGIVLHVEKDGSNDAYRMSFNRSNSSVIHVGRRPGAESESRTRDIDSGRAMFRCAVVSRKHAKIAFSDSGHVYLIDLSSHHGTHVRKPGELFSKALQAEVPSPLNDGDLVTFGKTVGRHEECVRPVVVRVELVRNPQPIKPLVVPPTPSDKSSSTSSKVSSGRYGVYSSYSSDERPTTPSLDNDSDIEAPAQPLSSCSQNKSETFPSSGIGRAFDMLKRLIPPSHTPNEGTGSEAPPFTLAPIAMSSDPSPPTLPPIQDAMGGTSAYKSRSNSPMDLESPSPVPPPLLPLLPSAELSLWDEGSQIGSQDSEDDNDSSSDSRGGSESPSLYDESEVEEEDARETSLPATPVGRVSAPLEFNEKASVTGSSEAEKSELQELKQTLERLQTDVTKLDNHRRKYRARFNNNVHRLAEKLTHYDDRLAEVNAQSDNLAEKVETITHIEIADITCQLEDMSEQIENLAYVDVPDLQERVDGLDDDMAALSRNASDAQDATESKQEAENQTKTLQDLVKEMQELRNKTEAEMAESLKEVKELCEATMALIGTEYRQAKAAMAAAIPSNEDPAPTSLKRKRDESDGSDTSVDLDSTMDDNDVLRLSAQLEALKQPFTKPGQDIEMFNFHIAPMSPEAIDMSRVMDASPRPKKRLRTIARVMAHTATAVTIGAVATWSALAFA